MNGFGEGMMDMTAVGGILEGRRERNSFTWTAPEPPDEPKQGSVCSIPPTHQGRANKRPVYLPTIEWPRRLLTSRPSRASGTVNVMVSFGSYVHRLQVPDLDSRPGQLPSYRLLCQ